MALAKCSVTIAHHKAFGHEPQQLDNILPVNVILGRNNTGKSALLDLIEFVCANLQSQQKFESEEPAVTLTMPVSVPALQHVFRSGTNRPPLGDLGAFGMEFADCPITCLVHADGKLTFGSIEPAFPEQVSQDERQLLVTQLHSPFEGHTFRRIVADRDVRPERAETLLLAGDGSGTTNLIQHTLNESTADETLVTEVMLSVLNRIFEPDGRFSRIQTKRLTNGEWEIYLEEDAKGSIPLSSSGSGLKTIMIVLAHLLLLPAYDNQHLSQYVFGLEELENNLHPGLQRRLFTYIGDLAVESGATVFITTHSHVVIDLFSAIESAQLLHVTHDGASAKLRPMVEFNDHGGVLSDLDVRASDLLQSNGVIWVEGPSDRVYVNRYLSLLYENEFKEGVHYQCLFYGGKLLARVTADPTENKEASLLRANRNCAIVMDRDTRRLNATKQRIKAEVKRVDGLVWVTKQKEIESYIPKGALRGMHNLVGAIDPIGDLEAFDHYLERTVGESAAIRYLRNKVLYAEQVCDLITTDMVRADGGLTKQLARLSCAIRSWNGGMGMAVSG
jgi:putative ATP-dependent endonuclease of the OLD family